MTLHCIFMFCIMKSARYSELAYRLQHADHADRVDVRGEFRRVERHLHMALRRKVVDLSWTDFADDSQYRHRVAKVGIVQVEFGSPLDERCARGSLPSCGGLFRERHNLSQEGTLPGTIVLTCDARDNGHFLLLSIFRFSD